MDARLTGEQAQLRDAAAKLATDLGPESVAALESAQRRARLDAAVTGSGWRTLRSDGASGVEVAVVAEELARGLVDTPFLGPILADDLLRHAPARTDDVAVAVAIEGTAFDARGIDSVVTLDGTTVLLVAAGTPVACADLTREAKAVASGGEAVVTLGAADARRWHALALAATAADLLGAARGAHALACDYAKIREQYGKTIGSYQAVAHLLAEGLALIEGMVSIVRHAAWAVDELEPDEAVRAAQMAKVYAARSALTVCENSIQVHGGIGNTWECLAHLYLRRVLVATETCPVTLKEISSGLS